MVMYFKNHWSVGQTMAPYPLPKLWVSISSGLPGLVFQVLPVYPRKVGISGAGALDVAEAAWIYVTGEALSSWAAVMSEPRWWISLTPRSRHLCWLVDIFWTDSARSRQPGTALLDSAHVSLRDPCLFIAVRWPNCFYRHSAFFLPTWQPVVNDPDTYIYIHI